MRLKILITNVVGDLLNERLVWEETMGRCVTESEQEQNNGVEVIGESDTKDECLIKCKNYTNKRSTGRRSSSEFTSLLFTLD